MFFEVFELEPHIFKGDSCAARKSNEEDEKRGGQALE
jgi:hypothetical protein